MKNEELYYFFIFLHHQTKIDMSKIHLIKGEFKEKLDLLFAPGVKAVFPSPAGDYLHESLDFNRDLIKHPEATFYGRLSLAVSNIRSQRGKARPMSFPMPSSTTTRARTLRQGGVISLS